MICWVSTTAPTPELPGFNQGIVAGPLFVVGRGDVDGRLGGHFWEERAEEGEALGCDPQRRREAGYAALFEEGVLRRL